MKQLQQELEKRSLEEAKDSLREQRAARTDRIVSFFIDFLQANARFKPWLREHSEGLKNNIFKICKRPVGNPITVQFEFILLDIILFILLDIILFNFAFLIYFVLSFIIPINALWTGLSERSEKLKNIFKNIFKGCKRPAGRPVAVQFAFILIGIILCSFILFSFILIWSPIRVLWALIHELFNLYKIIQLTLCIWLVRKPRIVWFNAWRHDKSEALWATFALTFLEEISKIRTPADIPSIAYGHIKLPLFRLDFSKGWLDLLKMIAQILIGIAVIVLVLIVAFKNLPSIDKTSDKSSILTTVITAVRKEFLNKDNHESDEAKTHQNTAQSQSKAGKNQTDSKSSTAKESNKKGTQTTDSSKSGDDKNGDDLIDKIAKLSLWSTGIGGSGFTILQILQQLHKVIGNPKKDLTEYLKSPNYEGQVSFIETFHKDFKKIVDAYAGKGNKTYVFIDDLDRCEVPKSAELMQAINLMISNDPQLIFILGMDREKVAAGLAVKHKEVIPYLSSAIKDDPQAGSSQTSLRGIEYGYSFIEKFVQLPFQVPLPSKGEFEAFVDNLSSKEPTQNSRWRSRWNFFWNPILNRVKQPLDWLERLSQEPSDSPNPSPNPTPKPENSTSEPDPNSKIQKRLTEIKIRTGADSEEVKNILTMVAPALDWNPRRLKQFLNLFRLRAYIASTTGLFDSVDGAPALTLEQLGKVTAIGVKWPLLMVELTKNAKLLFQLQMAALPSSEGMLPQQASHSTKNQWGTAQLLDLLRVRASEPGYSLATVDVKHLLQVSPLNRLDRVELRSDGGVDYKKLRQLLRDQEWLNADRETGAVMLKAVKQGLQGYLTNDMSKFPYLDLQTIDQLWTAASDDRFGFSVQKRIWQECGSPMRYYYNREKLGDHVRDNDNWENFGDHVGWRKGDEWVSDRHYLIFDRNKKIRYDLDNAPAGLFPLLQTSWDLHDKGWVRLLGVLGSLLARPDL